MNYHQDQQNDDEIVFQEVFVTSQSVLHFETVGDNKGQQRAIEDDGGQIREQ